MTILLAIDPGPEMSAYVIYDVEAREILSHNILACIHMLEFVEHCREKKAADILLVEFPECYGNKVSQSIFQTAFWAGRFVEGWGRKNRWEQVLRKTVTMQLCGKRTVGDPAVGLALRVRFAEPPSPRRPIGKLKGIANDEWAALGVAVAWAEKNRLDLARPAAWRK